ncbi:hypothetical protein ACFQHV_07370 [Promicromonospora thailandica]|uniref:DUF5666 domain-containing protein n=1 Tax=Promicromonospora thailandica TaxID=765201 RepID=A0A9X2GCD7_9MICO|nr:hypothetical protein [Promicromonospora thailandica]MCP2267219.1 hypothetical protein [Promicromonospora thailandica]BFF17472.1 hypothetical protein GCM10025730_09930 [Promicromonospora thailandica]
MRRTVRALIGVTLVGAGVASCAGTPSTGGPAYAEYTANQPGTGDGALLTGTVEDTAGCLTVRTDLDTRYVPVFPDTGESSRGLRPGDDVSLRGGELERVPGDVTLPEACPASGPFWLVVDG